MKTEKVVDHIVNWLKDYATNAKVNGFVIGVSGGIDSAVTSTLCAKTGLELLCLEMPIHQAKSHISRAQEHIAQLKQRFSNVSDTRVDLTPVFEEFKTEVSLNGDEATVDMANWACTVLGSSCRTIALDVSEDLVAALICSEHCNWTPSSDDIVTDTYSPIVAKALAMASADSSLSSLIPLSAHMSVLLS